MSLLTKSMMAFTTEVVNLVPEFFLWVFSFQ